MRGGYKYKGSYTTRKKKSAGKKYRKYKKSQRVKYN